MHILISLQQSVYDNMGKWITADSNIQMMAGLTRHLLNKTDWKVTWLMAPASDFKDFSLKNIGLYSESTSDEDPLRRLSIIEREMPVDAFKCRIQWDDRFYSGIKRVLQDVDVVINNDPSLGYNWAFLRHLNNYKYKIATCNYWMDCPEIGEEKIPINISYDWRQIEGSYMSDLVPFTCKSTRDAFFENLQRKFETPKFYKEIYKKSSIWDFGYDCNEFDVKDKEVPKTSLELCKLGKKVIFFPNRLSPINYTHHMEFIEAVNKLSEKRDDFVVVFANPSNKVSWAELKEKVKSLFIIKDSPLSRDEYCHLIGSGMIHSAVSLYLIERYGGCCFREYLEGGAIPVVPKVFEYAEILGDDFPIFVDGNQKNNKIDVNSLANALNESLDVDKSILVKAQQRNHNSCYCKAAEIAIEDIKKL